MLTLVIHSEDMAERVKKSLKGFELFDNGEIKINDREDGTFEIYLGKESLDDVVADIED